MSFNKQFTFVEPEKVIFAETVLPPTSSKEDATINQLSGYYIPFKRSVENLLNL